MFLNKNVLITGGTGSFGHYIAKMLLKKRTRKIIIFSRDEKKQDDMRYEFRSDPQIEFIIGDVRDYASVKAAVKGVDVVFHAAALKQVPSCEYNVREAVLTNVVGAHNIITACREEGVARVVAISTDKAVKPVNTMGMTKALQERLFISANLEARNKRPVYACVRYGNVIGSRGSVIPLFQKQLEHGGPLTITHPGMTRFVLTLGQAIDLVFWAALKAKGGEIFVKKLPALLVKDLAEVMARSGGKDIAIKNTGVRPGEKIHEALISEEESMRTVDSGNHYIVLSHLAGEGSGSHYRKHKAAEIFEYSSATAERLTKPQILNLLKDEGWISGSGDKKVV
jgi:UDP-N-acetylglucosamine 4,6-dehydratase/5-epimerase